MIGIALGALLVAAVAPAAAAVSGAKASTASRRRVREWVGSVIAAIALAAAAVVAATEPYAQTGPRLGAVLALAVAAAATGGVTLVPSVFALARRDNQHGPETTVLHGGLVIGILERVAVAVTVIAGWPEGVAVVMAVKGLARYPDLREPGASEHFIIGTFASVLWALAAGGVALGLAR